jgi:uncharacterized protein (TIGR03790 family)
MSRRTPSRAGYALLVVALGLVSSPAAAVPGPESVAVVANANLAESVALAWEYAAARQVPDRQVCLLDLPEVVDITLEEFQDQVMAGLVECLVPAEVLTRLEAVVLIRGVPLRVAIPTDDGEQRVSLAAALGVWQSTQDDGTPLLGQPPGQMAACGGSSTCYAARWPNPFRFGAFDAGWSEARGGVTWRPLLVTMLHGRTYEDAASLIESALEAESLGGAEGEFLFMDGADAARGALDVQTDAVIRSLRDHGYYEVSREPFDTNLTGRTLASFVTGTASLGETIEGNEYRPGALVDNLTSFGAVPVNFEESGESQVSIARWVALGVAGVHGTTDEPLNNCFPARAFVVDYVDGSTLAESFHRRLPFVYWRNLVLGDPMLAPYASRPEVVIEGVSEGDRIDDARQISVRASAPDAERSISWLALYQDGLEVGRMEADEGDEPSELVMLHCLDLTEGEAVQLLAVAQSADDGTIAGMYRPKGWVEVRIDGAPGRSECSGADDGGPGDADVRDAASPDGDGDADADADTDADADADADGDGDEGVDLGDDVGGCGCRTGPGAARVGLLGARRILGLGWEGQSW